MPGKSSNKNPSEQATRRRKTASADAPIQAKPKTRGTKHLRVDTAQTSPPAPHISVDRLLQAAESTLTTASEKQSVSTDPPVRPFFWQDLDGDLTTSTIDSSISPQDAELEVCLELGRSQLSPEEVLKLTNGSVVLLDRLIDEPVDIIVNGRLVARGEAIVMNEKFCVRVLELVNEGDL